ncbi:unnamed protein product, partial [Mesorhabditis spiculigera]
MTADLEKPEKTQKRFYVGRSLAAFWLFGICNNFAYVVMLSAAQDILRVEEMSSGNLTVAEEVCLPDRSHRVCTQESAGLVLMLNILPMFFVKLIAPFFIDYLPYGTRNALVVITQAMALLITAFATSVPVALTGVAVASISCGFGEMMYLGLAAHYSANTITSWSSGTGMAGILGSILYAAMTDPRMLGLSPKISLLLMLIAPFIFTLTYWMVLVRAPTVRKTVFYEPRTWIDWGPRSNVERLKEERERPSDEEEDRKSDTFVEIYGSYSSLRQKISITLGLMKYMVPLGTVFFAQYFINQGLAELIVFDCDNSFHSSPESQYKWYQVLYQIGIFISRSAISLIPMPFWVIAWMLPLSQLSILGVLLVETLSPYFPHIIAAYGIIFLEGLTGGSAYGNTVRHVHQNVSPSIKEFALLIVTVSDTVGILLAAALAIPTHNQICGMPYYKWF